MLCQVILWVVVAAAAGTNMNGLFDDCIVNEQSREPVTLRTFRDKVDFLMSTVDADTLVSIRSGGNTCHIRISKEDWKWRNEWLPATLSLAGQPSLEINGRHFHGGERCSSPTKPRKEVKITYAFVLWNCHEGVPNFYISHPHEKSLEIPWRKNEVDLILLPQATTRILLSVGGNDLFLCKSSDGETEVKENATDCGSVESDTRVHLSVSRSDGSYRIKVDDGHTVNRNQTRNGEDLLKFPLFKDMAGSMYLMQCLGEFSEATVCSAATPARGDHCSFGLRLSLLAAMVISLSSL